MTWVRLDDGFWSNPKIEKAGNEAAGVYVRALSYCGNHLTEGRVTAAAMRFITTRRKPIDALLAYGLIVADGQDYLIPDFLEFNPTREEALAVKAARSEAGRRGGLASGRSRQANSQANGSAKGEANA